MEASVSPLEATAAQTRAAVAPVDRARVETHASAASGREAPRRAEPAPAAGKKLSAADFDYGSILGAGSFGNVFHVRLHGSNQEYAMKVMQKSFIRKEQKIHFVKMERDVLTKAHHPNIIKLAYSFQDEENLYIVTELCRGGELLRAIRTFNSEARRLRAGRADDGGRQDSVSDSGSDSDDWGGGGGGAAEARAAAPPAGAHPGLALNAWGSGVPVALARFYAAQLVCVLEYLHTSLHVVHRDLKPENVLLSRSGHVKLADFGSAKDEGARFDDARQDAFVGTAEYVSPEVLRDEPAHAPADLWALGCVLYQLLAGVPPFRGGSEYLTFQQILGWDADLNDPEKKPQQPQPSGGGSLGDIGATSLVGGEPVSIEPSRIMRRSSSGELSTGSADRPRALSASTYVGIGAVVVEDSSRATPLRGARGSSTGGLDAEQQQLLAFLETIPEDAPAVPAVALGALPLEASDAAVSPATPPKPPGRRGSGSTRQQFAAALGEARRASRAGSISAALASRPPPSILRFPAGFPDEARHLILSLLRPTPAARIGVAVGDAAASPVSGVAADAGLLCGPVRLRYSAIKAHPFFEGVDWAQVCNPGAPAPFVPAPGRLRPPRPALEVHLGAASGASTLASLDSDDSSALHVLPHVKAAVAAAQKQAAALRHAAAATAAAPAVAPAAPPVPSSAATATAAAALSGAGDAALAAPTSPRPADGKSPAGPVGQSAVASTPVADPKRSTLGKALSAMFLPLFGSPRGGPADAPSGVIDAAPIEGSGAEPAEGGGGKSPGRRLSSEGISVTAAGAAHRDLLAGTPRPRVPPRTDPGPSGGSAGAAADEPPPPGSGGGGDSSWFRPSAVSSATPSRSRPSSPLPEVRFFAEDEPQPVARHTPTAPSAQSQDGGAAAAACEAGAPSSPPAPVPLPEQPPAPSAGADALPAPPVDKAQQQELVPLSPPAPAPPRSSGTLLSFVRDGYIAVPAPGDTGLMPVRIITLPSASSTGPSASGAVASPPLLSLGGGGSADPPGKPRPLSVPPPGSAPAGEVAGQGATPAALPPPPPASSSSSSQPPWWLPHVQAAAGETVVRSGAVEKRKGGYLLFGPTSRELVLCQGGPGGPRLLYCNPHTREKPVSIALADPDVRLVLRESPATARARAEGLGGGAAALTLPSARLGSELAAGSGMTPPVPPTPLARFATWLGLGSSSANLHSVGAGSVQPPPLALDAPALAAPVPVGAGAAATPVSLPRGDDAPPRGALTQRDPAGAESVEAVPSSGGAFGAVAAASAAEVQQVASATTPAVSAAVSAGGGTAAAPPAAAASEPAAAVFGASAAAPTPLHLRPTPGEADFGSEPGSAALLQSSLTTPGGTGSGTLLDTPAQLPRVGVGKAPLESDAAGDAAAEAGHEEEVEGGLVSPPAVALRISHGGTRLEPSSAALHRAPAAAAPAAVTAARVSRLGSMQSDVATFDIGAFGGAPPPPPPPAAPPSPALPPRRPVSSSGSVPPLPAAAASPVPAAAAGLGSPISGLAAAGGAPPAGRAPGAAAAGGGAATQPPPHRDLGVLDVVTGGRSFFLLDPLGGADEWLLAAQVALRDYARERGGGGAGAGAAPAP